jgi:hypothetical protein
LGNVKNFIKSITVFFLNIVDGYQWKHPNCPEINPTWWVAVFLIRLQANLLLKTGMANNTQTNIDSKPLKNLQPYLSQQFFNWILTITVAFLLGKSCWSSGKTNQQPNNCCCTQTLVPANSTPLSSISPSIRNDSIYNTSPQPRPSLPSRQLIRGPRGGCYYINESGNKVYVDRSLCD